MSTRSLSDMISSLDRLERAVNSIVLQSNGMKDTVVASRIASYKEILRRQRDLISELSEASRRRDFSEVRRLSSLVHGSSLMIKVDAEFLISSLKAKSSSRQSA